MRSIVAFVGFAAACALAAAPAPRRCQNPPPFAWEKDLDTALAAARRDLRPVMAYFTYDG
ncbi:MAG: hypothetical protein HY286_07880 [Planctomycetes bacterium]|nr:hypothetical protein [Planctomycetota bacterium]